MPRLEAIIDPLPSTGHAAPLVWRGRSGRRYCLTREAGAASAMGAQTLYALEAGGIIRWAGMAEDLIADPRSRERFRRAHADGAALFSLPAPQDPLAVMTLAWDLDGSHNVKGRDAA